MEPDSTTIFDVVLIASALLFVFASLAESAINSTSRARFSKLAEQDPSAAAVIANVLDNLPVYLSTMAIVRQIGIFGSAVSAAILLRRAYGESTTALIGWIVGGVLAVL